MLKIEQLTPEIYHLKFEDSDTMALHFLRFTDYYESANTVLYRQKFNLSDSLEQAFQRGKDATDFDGVNLPISIIYRMAKEYGSNLTIQERFILGLIDVIKADQPALKYLIATDGDSIHHELAHGFYYTDQSYKLKMDALISTLPKRVKDEVYGYLKRLEYHPSVYNDEFQAYMATGFLGEEKEVVNEYLINMFRARFFDVFLETLAENEIK